MIHNQTPEQTWNFKAWHHFQLPSSSINILEVVHLPQPAHLPKKHSPKGHIDLLKASWILHTSPFKWPFLCWVVKEMCACVKQGPQQNYPNEHRKSLVFKRKLLKYDTSPTCKMPRNVGALGAFWRDDPLSNYEFAVLKLGDAPTQTFLNILPFSTPSNSYFFQFSICNSGNTIGWGSFLNFQMKAKARNLQRCGVGAMETHPFSCLNYIPKM